MKKGKLKIGIFHKTVLIMTLVSLIPFGVIWYVNLLTTRTQISQHVDAQLSGVAESLVTYVDAWFEMNQRMLMQNSQSDDIRSMNPARQEPIMKAIVENYDWNYLAFTVAPDGQNIARSDGKPLKYYGDRAYVKQVLNGSPLGEQVLIGKTSGLPALVLSVPISDEQGGLDGVLAIAMTVGEVSAKVVDAGIGMTGEAFMLDSKGRVIAHRSDEFTKTRKDLQQHPAFVAYKARGQNKLVFEDAAGERQIAYIKETGQGWLMVVKQSYAEAFHAIQVANEYALVLLCITAVLVVLAAYLLSKGMSRPIIRLTEIAEQISRGDMSVKVVGMRRRDEIGSLARAIERLSISVRVAMRRLAQRNAATSDEPEGAKLRRAANS